jgi:hypothetical protein
VNERHRGQARDLTNPLFWSDLVTHWEQRAECSDSRPQRTGQGRHAQAGVWRQQRRRKGWWGMGVGWGVGWGGVGWGGGAHKAGDGGIYLSGGGGRERERGRWKEGQHRSEEGPRQGGREGETVEEEEGEGGGCSDDVGPGRRRSDGTP